MFRTLGKMVKNFERRSRSVLAVKRATFSDSGSKTNEENYSAPPPLPHPSPPSQVSFSDGSDRIEALRVTTSLLDADSIERLLKVAQQALSSRRRDGVDGGPEGIPRRIAAAAAAHPHEAPGSEDSLRSIEIRQDNETKLLSAEEFQTRNSSTRAAKSPSIHTAVFSREANATDSESRQFRNTDDATRHPKNSVLSPTTAAAAGGSKKSFSVDHQSSNPVPGRADPRRSDETAADALCRGYSTQRRHGRKASLGTTDITRLIPTLVSDNDGFRDREYQRKISLPSNGAAHNLTL